MIILCVGILTVLPIKTLIYLAEKLPPKENYFPISVPAVYEEEFLSISVFFIILTHEVTWLLGCQLASPTKHSIWSLFMLPSGTFREERHYLEYFQKLSPLLPGIPLPCLFISNLSTFHCYSIHISCLKYTIPISHSTVSACGSLYGSHFLPSPGPPAAILTMLTMAPCFFPLIPPLRWGCSDSKRRTHFNLSKRHLTAFINREYSDASDFLWVLWLN